MMLRQTVSSLLRPGPPMPPSSTAATFFSLPPEIRVRIYEYLLSDPDRRVYIADWDQRLGSSLLARFSKSNSRCYRRYRRWMGKSNVLKRRFRVLGAPPDAVLHPAILRTNGQIYGEAVNVLYARNVFDLGNDRSTLRSFLDRIGAANAQTIRTIVLPPLISLPPRKTFVWHSPAMLRSMLLLDAVYEDSPASMFCDELQVLPSVCPEARPRRLTNTHARVRRSDPARKSAAESRPCMLTSHPWRSTCTLSYLQCRSRCGRWKILTGS